MTHAPTTPIFSILPVDGLLMASILGLWPFAHLFHTPEGHGARTGVGRDPPPDTIPPILHSNQRFSSESNPSHFSFFAFPSPCGLGPPRAPTFSSSQHRFHRVRVIIGDSGEGRGRGCGLLTNQQRSAKGPQIIAKRSAKPRKAPQSSPKLAIDPPPLANPAPC